MASQSANRKAIVEYVEAVNSLLDTYDEDARFQKAMEQSQAQIDYIFSLRERLRKETKIG